MIIPFYKYQGTGNDFIIIDNRQNIIDKNDTKRIKTLSDRRFGIGADGFILLEHADDADFKMVYYNADGRISSMCGNGGRCIVAFARYLGIIKHDATFNAVDGLHQAKITDDHIHLKMQDVHDVDTFKNHVFLDTGSPHHVEITENLEQLDVKSNGASIRHSTEYGDYGCNVNFVEPVDSNVFKVRTYERGVEDETYSCGTGVTAVALAMYKKKLTCSTEVLLKTLGGELMVRFDLSNKGFKNIWLTGPAKQVFKGEVTW